MDLDEYQTLATRTMKAGQNPRDDLAMTGLGLAGEAGECVDLLKKHLFHGHDLDKNAITKELGDVLWYVATLAKTLDLSLGDIAQKNIDKLKARYPEGFTDQASRERKV